MEKKKYETPRVQEEKIVLSDLILDSAGRFGIGDLYDDGIDDYI